MPTDAQIDARKEWAARKCKREAQATAAVVHFLLDHPLSTAEEVFKATGYSPMSATRFCYHLKYHGQTVWRVNRWKWEEYWNSTPDPRG